MKYSIKKEREKIGTTLLSLYENKALRTLATRINDINRKKENVNNPVINNYIYEFEKIIYKYSGNETKLIMECVINDNMFNEFIKKCTDINITLYNFKHIITNLNTKLLYLNERYIKGNLQDKLIILKPLILDIIEDLNSNFHEYLSDITKKAI